MTNKGSGMEVLDLDALVRPIGKVRLGGNDHDVRPISGRAYGLLATFAKTGKDATIDEQLAVGRKIASDIVPTLSASEVESLTIDQILAIIGKATIHVDKVKDAIDSVGNAESPAQ